MKTLSKFLKDNKDVLVGVLKAVIFYLLKLQVSGGIRGWLIRTLVKEFAEEVFEVIQVTVDYVEIKRKVNDTATNEDRNEATDTLNDIMR